MNLGSCNWLVLAASGVFGGCVLLALLWRTTTMTSVYSNDSRILTAVSKEQKGDNEACVPCEIDSSTLATNGSSELTVKELFWLSWKNYKKEIPNQWKYIDDALVSDKLVKLPFLAAEPFFTCPFLQRVGGMDDGAKFLCGMNFFPQDNCVIYSLGVYTNTKFEWDLYSKAPQCKIFSFDPTPSLLETYKTSTTLFPPSQKHYAEAVTGKAGVGVTISGKRVPSRSLAEIRQGFSHAVIHAFKIDIESGEYELFEDISDDDWNSIEQIQVEVHVSSERKSVERFFRLLRLFDSKGFVMFMKDPNLYCAGCYEYAFLNVKKFAAKLGLDPSLF